jgi:hypothetical protein
MIDGKKNGAREEKKEIWVCFFFLYIYRESKHYRLDN